MADDLIVKFFQQDLTEAEEAALSERLSASVEEALRFGQHAETAYRYYGLPEPEWPGSSPGGGRPLGGWKTWVWIGLAGLAGLGGWALWRHGPLAPSAAGARTEAGTQTGAGPRLHHPFSPKTIRREAAGSPAAAFPAHPPARETRVSDVPRGPGAQTTGGTRVTPVPRKATSRDAHTNLEVVVKRRTAGQVTVQVLKPDGNRAVLLYQGPLKAGSWAFDWDGRLADGSPPAPGIYRIEVESDSVTLSKKVVVQPELK